MTWTIDEFSFANLELRIGGLDTSFSNEDREIPIYGQKPMIIPTTLSSKEFSLSGNISAQSGMTKEAINEAIMGIMERKLVSISHDTVYLHGTSKSIWAKPTSYSINLTAEDGTNRIPIKLGFKLVGISSDSIQMLCQVLSIENAYDFV